MSFRAHAYLIAASFTVPSTLLAVGVYLIASSLIARWVSQWGTPGIQTEAIVFLPSIMALAAILLTTQFRHRARLWIRRNIFAGKYDYRHYWMEAVEKVRWEDDPKPDLVDRGVGLSPEHGPHRAALQISVPILEIAYLDAPYAHARAARGGGTGDQRPAL